MKNTSRRRVPGMPLANNGRIKQETDHPDQEDLILFRELHKREKERNTVTLLQPVSEEFEPNGNYQLYRIASAKKGSGFEFLAENEKNDYDCGDHDGWMEVSSPAMESLLSQLMG